MILFSHVLDRRLVVVLCADGDNNPNIAALSYEKASGGRVPKPDGGPSGRVVVPKVNNVSGSTAGAGSNNFHEYRGERRREYFRLKHMEEDAAKEEADAAFRAKLEAEKAECEKKTAARAAKRLKRKAALKAKRKAGKASGGDGDDSGSASEGERDADGAPEAKAAVDAPAAEKRTRVDVSDHPEPAACAEEDDAASTA